jgi:ATP-dependent Clp protease protease subunit
MKRHLTLKSVLVKLSIIVVGFFVSLGLAILLSEQEASVSAPPTSLDSTYIDKPAILPELEDINNPEKVEIHKLQLNPKRVLTVVGPVDSSIKRLIIQSNLLDQEETSPIYMLIDSPGGSVLDGSALISAMKTLKSPVYTICVGMCASMAAMIHQEGTKRLMTESSILMFHPASGTSSGTLDLMQNELTLFKSIVYRMESRVSRRWKMDVDEYKQRTQNELWLTSWDALDKGVTDDIVYINVDVRELSKLNLEDSRIKNIPTSNINCKFYWIYEQ